MRATSENSSKFRQAACQTITTLLEHSDHISKWQYVLERKNEGSEQIHSEGLGLFLRLLHYYAVTLLETETEYTLLQSELKLCTTLLNTTPYARMLPGLSVLLTETVLDQLKSDQSQLAKWSQRVPALTNSALRTLQQAFEAFATLKTQFSQASAQGIQATAVPSATGLQEAM